MVLWAMRSTWWISSQMLAHSVKGVTVSPVLELRFVRAVGLPCRWDCQSISLFGLLLDETSASLPSNGKVMPLELGAVFSVSLFLLLVLCFTALTTHPIIPFEIFQILFLLHLLFFIIFSISHPRTIIYFFLSQSFSLTISYGGSWFSTIFRWLNLMGSTVYTIRGLSPFVRWTFLVMHTFFFPSQASSCPLWPLKLEESLNTGTWILMTWICEWYSHLLSI